MKIAYIGQKGIPCQQGGIEKCVEVEATNMAKKGHDIFVYYKKRYKKHKRKTWKKIRLLKVPSISNKYLETPISNLIATIKVLFRKVDIIHYQGVSTGLWMIIPKIFKPSTKIIWTFHSDDTQHAKWGFIARTVFKIAAQFGFWFADYITTTSEVLKKQCEKQYKRKLICVPNGSYIPKKEKIELIKKKWNLKNKDYLLSVSRLVRHKGIHLAIKAFNQMKTDKKLVIVGGSTYTDKYVKEIKALAKSNPNIIFTDVVKGKALKELYSHAYAFIQPSFSEGMSLSLLEAMSYGLPIVSSDIPENVEPLADGGLYFGKGNIKSLKKNLVTLINSKIFAKKLGKKARRNIEEFYNWDEHMKRMEEVYNAN